MSAAKILLVDDHEALREMMQLSLENHDFQVVPAKGVTEALNQIVTQPFDVLITDLHMPNPGDGFTVVSAMRHSQPDALTLVISGFPDVQEAMAAILLQADEVLVKPFDVKQLVDLLRKRTQEKKRRPKPAKESVASILERDATITVQRWLARVKRTEELACVPLSDSDRTGHVSEIIKSIVIRLRDTRAIEVTASPSPAAVAHGRVRYRQGYDAPMIVHESRILQVCIFETIQRNLAVVDFSLVLPDVMLIADEVDSQLTQSVASFLKDAAATAA
jgi:ActR/RegA family two-component response regulator